MNENLDLLRASQGAIGMVYIMLIPNLALEKYDTSNQRPPAGDTLKTLELCQNEY